MPSMLVEAAKLFAIGSIAFFGATPAKAQAPIDPAASTHVVEQAIVETKLLEVAPSDVHEFCPAFDILDAPGKLAFWTALLGDVANAESHYNARKTTWRPYDDAVHRPAFRRGLLQISIEAAHSPKYQCDLKNSAELRDPDSNLACGARILAVSVMADSAIAHRPDGRIAGGARYWPSLKRTGSRAAIALRTSMAAPCGATHAGAQQ